MTTMRRIAATASSSEYEDERSMPLKGPSLYSLAMRKDVHILCV